MKLVLACALWVACADAMHQPTSGVRPALYNLRGGESKPRGLFDLRGGGRKAKDLEEPPPPVSVAPKGGGGGGLSLAATCIGAVVVWIGFATLYYAKYENWPYAQSLFYAVDTGMSIGFGTVAEQKLSTKLFTVAHVLMGASAVGGAIALFAESAVAGSTAIANAEYTMASVRATFTAADTDESGSLSHEELEAVLRKCCPRLSPEEMSVAIRLFDFNGDGQITIDEFLAAVSKYVDGETTVDEAVKLCVEAKTSGALSAVVKAVTTWLSENRLIALWFVWILAGATWGVLTEGWHPINGLYFAVGALGKLHELEPTDERPVTGRTLPPSLVFAPTRIVSRSPPPLSRSLAPHSVAPRSLPLLPYPHPTSPHPQPPAAWKGPPSTPRAPSPIDRRPSWRSTA